MTRILSVFRGRQLLVTSAVLLVVAAVFSLAYSVHAATDITAPSVTSVTPTQGWVSGFITFSATYDDEPGGEFGVGVDSCDLWIGGVNQGAMTLSDPGGVAGTASKAHAFSSAGAHLAQVNCVDGMGFSGWSAVISITAFTDSGDPSVSNVQPTIATAGSAVSITAYFDDTEFGSGVTNCGLVVASVESGTWDYSGAGDSVTSGTTTFSYTFSSAGSHLVEVVCFDLVGRSGSGSTTVTVASAPDTTAPVVNITGPATATEGVAVTVSATATDDTGIASCSLYVNGVNQGTMSLSGTSATRSHTFATAGTYSLQVRCQDAATNQGTSNSTVTVSTSGTGPAVGSLLKITCPAGTLDVNHPCKAVYYYGSDGKRHAFPNDKVYFTWYTDFSGITEVTSGFMASLTLGKNVVYRPGVKLVKFTTLSRVYAVSRSGELRWVKSATAAQGMYGSDWGLQIDDINDVFFMDYSYGVDINSSADFNPATETATVTSINDNL